MIIALFRRLTFALSLCLLFIASQAGAASVVPWLYEVAVPVASQAPAERLRASADALLIMLTRATGLTSVPRTEIIKNALDNPESFYSRFRFADGQDGGIELVVQFEPRAILELQKEASLPIWRSARERVMVWLVLEEDGVRSVVGAESHESIGEPIGPALLSSARARGLDLTLPLLDLEDQFAVTPAAVWGRLSAVLEPASERYGADVVLVGRVRAAAGSGWSGEWELWLNKEVVSYQTSGPDLLLQAGEAVDWVADTLAGRSAVLGRESGSLQLSVSGIRTATDYAGLLRYLQGLEFIDQVSVRQLRGDTLRVDLLTRADAVQLLGLFEADQWLFVNRLVANDPADLQLVWRHQ